MNHKEIKNTIEKYVKQGYTEHIATCIAFDEYVIDSHTSLEDIIQFTQQFPYSYITLIAMRELIYQQRYDTARFLVEKNHVTQLAKEEFFRIFMIASSKVTPQFSYTNTSSLDDVD